MLLKGMSGVLVVGNHWTKSQRYEAHGEVLLRSETPVHLVHQLDPLTFARVKGRLCTTVMSKFRVAQRRPETSAGLTHPSIRPAPTGGPQGSEAQGSCVEHEDLNSSTKGVDTDASSKSEQRQQVDEDEDDVFAFAPRKYFRLSDHAMHP